MTICYLAQPIDFADVSPEVMRAVHEKLAALRREDPHMAVYRPAAAWTCGGATPEVQAVNAEALARARVVVAVLPADGVTLGVPLELGMALGSEHVKWFEVYAPSTLRGSFVLAWLLRLPQVNLHWYDPASSDPMNDGGEGDD